MSDTATGLIAAAGALLVLAGMWLATTKVFENDDD